MKWKIPDRKTTAASPTCPVLVRPYQIVIPVALSIGGHLTQRFPAILDPGHSHNFSLSETHVSDWVRKPLRQVGWIKVNNVRVPLVQADVDLDGTMARCTEGISVFPDTHPSCPRLPLLGLRALVRNHIRIRIEHGEVEIA
jgi:hypothetical protein